jgi:dihydropteroate synthase
MALRAPGALDVVASGTAAVCLMHMQGEPRTMQLSPHYDDVTAEVSSFLFGRAAACEAAGIARDRILLDPGFGFGKSVDHNLTLLAGMPQLCAGPWPVLAGLSRKSMLSALTGRAVDQRLAGSVTLATIALLNGARIIRSHDVAESRDCLRVVRACMEAAQRVAEES